MLSYHYINATVSWPSHLYNGNPFSGKTASLYWTGPWYIYLALSLRYSVHTYRNLVTKDRRAEPRSGQRVPYIIVYGRPGLPLIQLVHPPEDLLHDPSLRPNATYYISKQILPPLNRIFSLLGVDVYQWYTELPRVVRSVPTAHFAADSKKVAWIVLEILYYPIRSSGY